MTHEIIFIPNPFPLPIVCLRNSMRVLNSAESWSHRFFQEEDGFSRALNNRPTNGHQKSPADFRRNKEIINCSPVIIDAVVANGAIPQGAQISILFDREESVAHHLLRAKFTALLCVRVCAMRRIRDATSAPKGGHYSSREWKGDPFSPHPLHVFCPAEFCTNMVARAIAQTHTFCSVI